MNIENYEEIVNGMREIAGKSPLGSPDPRLIAVVKGQPWEKVNLLLGLGHRDFGENRWQEARDRWRAVVGESPTEQSDARSMGFGAVTAPSKITLHFIGPLQTNKVAEVVEFFDVIHSLDRQKLADALHKEDCTLPCYIQVNTGEEPQKAGVMPKEAAAFIRYCRDELKLNIVGLMGIPPADVNPAPHFAFLRQLAQEHRLPRLSMGMSGDWQTALRLGATEIRVGSALFGERK